jgi:hypothetical protein
MHSRNLVLWLIAGLIGTGCTSNETKPEAAPAPVQATATQPPPAASKPKCEPAKTTKKSSKKSSAKSEKTPVPDCEAATPAKTTAAPVPDPAPAKETAAKSEPGKPRVVKSRDGTFEGEIYGNIPPGSKWARLQIGMQQAEVERILGVTANIRGFHSLLLRHRQPSL